MRTPFPDDPCQAEGCAQIVATPIQRPEGNIALDAVSHFAPSVEAADRLLELPARQAIEQIDDAVLQSAPWQAVYHVQNAQTAIITSRQFGALHDAARRDTEVSTPSVRLYPTHLRASDGN